MLRTPLLAFLLALSACAARSGYERARVTSDTTADYRDRVGRVRDQVGLTTGALRALAENPGESPRSNRETFQTFERELANLEAFAQSSRKTYGKMDARAETFFGSWTEDTAQITDADLKQSTEQRRAALKASYANLAAGQRDADQALAAFVLEMTNLRLCLENDLTTAGIAATRPSMEKSFAHGAALEEQLGRLAAASDAARESLAPLRALAPSQQRVEADGRVH